MGLRYSTAWVNIPMLNVDWKWVSNGDIKQTIGIYRYKSACGYKYGLRADDCRHTKKFIIRAIKDYYYVRELANV